MWAMAHGGLWNAIGADDRALLQAAGHERTYSAGEYLFQEGTAPTDVIVVRSGLVKLTKSNADGREVMLELRGPGELLCEMSAVDGSCRSATGVAIRPVSALSLPASRFTQLLAEQPRLSFAVLRTVVERVRQSAERQLEGGTADSMARICARLIELAGPAAASQAGPIVIKSPLTQQELGDWSGVSRDAATLALGTLRKLGWLETGRRRFVIRNYEGILKRAGA